MPNRDGSGPGGFGPRTGHGSGYCNSFDRPGAFRRDGGGFGRGNGCGRGNGFGRRNGLGRMPGGYSGMDFPYMGVKRISDAEYKTLLSEEADLLEKRLAEIKDQLSAENSAPGNESD